MNKLKDYKAYIQDNPNGYWFKRKMYGWGWTPVKWQGWLTFLIYIGFVLYVAITPSPEAQSLDEIKAILVPVGLATVLMITVAWRTGEPLKWQWGIPEKKE